MKRRLPSLNALRAFEAAARHLSFTRAAEELHVTQAAVSHQIKALETDLGVPLFLRVNRSLTLSDGGQTLFRGVSEALDIMTVSVERLYHHDQSGALIVSTMDSFAANWLVPRLGRFREAYPEIDVHLAISDARVDFGRANVDLAIRYGHGEWADLHIEKLMAEQKYPVCAPGLLEGDFPLRQPSDLKNFTLLHDDMRVDWRMWLMAAGETGVDASKGPGYHHSNLALQAAKQGDGVALARSVLVAEALASGQLVKPFDFMLPAEYAYYVVCPEANLARPKIRVFRNWLFEEVGPVADAQQ
ncbi:MAG: transcriptional regulator GcvA [Stappiaceae bacterium]